MRLYVGNLPYSVDTDQLRDLFMPYGEVRDAHLVMDRETNRPRGFAFVEMGSDAEASAAMEGLDGSSLDGRNLKVNIAKPRESRGGGGGGRW